MRPAQGFTLVELLVTFTLAAILLLVAAPTMRLWLLNTQVRSVAEALQNGLRLAQNESLRSSRQVVFSLTNATPALNAAAASNGRNWSVQALPLMSGGTEPAQFVQGGAFGDATSAVAIAGPAAICFNSMGRQASATSAVTGVGQDCSVDPAAPTTTYDISVTGGDRPLRVTVSIGGQIRMCDPARALSASPDGCP